MTPSKAICFETKRKNLLKKKKMEAITERFILRLYPNFYRKRIFHHSMNVDRCNDFKMIKKKYDLI